MKKFLTLTLGVASLATGAMAANLNPSAIDTADFIAVAGVVLVASGVFYGIRRALALLR